MNWEHNTKSKNVGINTHMLNLSKYPIHLHCITSSSPKKHHPTSKVNKLCFDIFRVEHVLGVGSHLDGWSWWSLASPTKSQCEHILASFQYNILYRETPKQIKIHFSYSFLYPSMMLTNSIQLLSCAKNHAEKWQVAESSDTCYHLVGGFNPFDTYQSNWIISPSRGEHKK